ncbi:glycine oxidase ThiO [Acidimicrobium ferrooxidans]|uniref:glycine oxidase ThiO n=1 Tax=Acidimicrobium ferrooxidans TaxID=53635 RepID=UPI001494ADDA|nr:glycine oxidase ThiO [Acidimicrobium ferrooxidans]
MDRVVVVGAGIAGMTIAVELARRGARVQVIADPSRSPTTPVAAGMLAPAAETDFGEDLLVRLEQDARTAWEALAATLERNGDTDVLFEVRGSLVAAQTPGDLDHLRRMVDLQRRFGMTASLLGARDLVDLEPALSSHLAGGALLPDDAQVDNRRALAAYDTWAAKLGIERIEAAVRAVHPDAVELADTSRLQADTVVVAAGSWLRDLVEVALQPVRGVTIRGTLPVGLAPRHCLRGELRGRRVYIVPRASHEIVIGATSDEAPLTDRDPRARDLLDLLDDARTLAPAMGELAVTDVSVGFRPATPDNLPIVGRGDDGVWVHGGHYRHGILLAPFTATLLADAIVGDGVDPRLAALSPTRLRSRA